MGQSEERRLECDDAPAHAHFEPPALLRAKVEAGELGKKSGRGFYDWTGE